MESPSFETQAAETFRRLGPAGKLAIGALLLPLAGTALLLTFLTRLAPWLASHSEMGVVIYVVGFAILSGVAILPTHAAAILGGWAFKFAQGFPASMLGFLGGAIIGFVIARRASGEHVMRVLDEQPKWKAVYLSLLCSGFWKTLLIVTLLRLPPNSPFAMTNLVLAATKVPFIPYIAGTLLGMSPRVGLIVYFASLASDPESALRRNWWLFGGGIVCTLVIFAILALLGKRGLARVSTAAAEPS